MMAIYKAVSAAVPLLLLTAGLFQGTAAEHVQRHEKSGDKKLRLRAGPRIPSLLDPEDELHQAVDMALGTGHDILHEELLAIRESLMPMWNALAKNDQGRIDRRSLRYVVHRYFLQRYSLSLVGLEPLHSSSSHSEAALLAAHAPTYVRSVLEGRSAGVGFSIEDVAAMVAVLERLVEDSGHDILEGVYTRLGFNSGRSLDRTELFSVLEGYMVRWMLGDDTEGIQIVEANQTLLEESFEHWEALKHFAHGRVRTFEAEQALKPKLWSPLAQRFPFEAAQAIAGGITTSFGPYWETECLRVKESLVHMDTGATGRVRLSDFHGAALDGEWRFSESKDYLRQLGALDESSTLLGPRVVIPNYMQAVSNCIVTSEHYRVCCSNECEAYLGEIEVAVAAPSASPEEILSVVGNLTSGLEDVKPRLGASMQEQLAEIARADGGRVPLHGRLFAQWLHYVFPQECPFPHKAGTTTSLSPLEFGQEYMASESEMSRHSGMANLTSSHSALEEDWMAQWSQEEELVAENLHLRAPWESRITTSVVGVGFTLALIAGGLLQKVRGSPRSGQDLLPMTAPFSKAHYI
mmetsp:Transcript_72406/g.154996  ORF Transcript_72406/g.154996 Transcript_72406/m.154996 type:complete len:578 (-) Transcript_72406:83-1816(-)